MFLHWIRCLFTRLLLTHSDVRFLRREIKAGRVKVTYTTPGVR